MSPTSRSAETSRIPTETGALPERSEWRFRWFSRWVRGYLGKHFHAVRLSRGCRPVVAPDLPLVVVLNHPSWWDPLIGIVLAGLFPERAHYVPMDARALARYRILGKLGFYGVERGTREAALAFLGRTKALLSQPASAVWVTAQGRFSDARRRPPGLRSGIGHLARCLDQGEIVTLALEYPFWDERLPEALARFGTPIRVGHAPNRRARAWVECLESELAATQDLLAADAMSRDPARFETLLTGRVGIGGVYDVWRRCRAWCRGQRFVAGHGSGAEAW